MSSCFYCIQPATLLCDGKVLTSAGEKSCDRYLCTTHRHLVSAGIACVRGGRGKNRSHTFTIDYCLDCKQANGKRIESKPEVD